MVAVKTDCVETYVRDRFAGSLYEGRNILVDEGAALKHDVSAEVAELVDERAAADDGKVIFGGRLGLYKYFDMDKVIEAALDLCQKELY